MTSANTIKTLVTFGMYVHTILLSILVPMSHVDICSDKPCRTDDSALHSLTPHGPAVYLMLVSINSSPTIFSITTHRCGGEIARWDWINQQ